MSTFSVSPVQVSALSPIAGADRIEAATVAGYQVVVGKGQWAPGDWALYIPESAILPPKLISDMGLDGRLAGSAKNRVKAVRLRGCLSQGLLLPMPKWAEDIDPSDDYSEALGITKWRPIIPAKMAGNLKPAPDIMRWIEVENIRKLRMLSLDSGWYDPFEGTRVSVTEKVHGTCFIATLPRDGEVMVSSKGIAGRACSLEESPTNLYWQAYHDNNLGGVLAGLLRAFPDAASVSLYGEVFGPGIQDLTYGQARPAFAAFDARVGHEWLTRWGLAEACLGHCEVVPELYQGPYDHDTIWSLANGQNVAGAEGAHIREGVVVRCVPERLHGGQRLIAKFVSEAYLLRKDGTEYD